MGPFLYNLRGTTYPALKGLEFMHWAQIGGMGPFMHELACTSDCGTAA